MLLFNGSLGCFPKCGRPCTPYISCTTPHLRHGQRPLAHPARLSGCIEAVSASHQALPHASQLAKPHKASVNRQLPAWWPPATAATSHNVLPVTVLSGFLGSGKTTLLRHILTNKAGLRAGVLVNDMATINIDASLVAAHVSMPDGGQMVALHNGCICCSIREDLMREITRLAASGDLDFLIIESTGVALPMPVAASFAALEGDELVQELDGWEDPSPDFPQQFSSSSADRSDISSGTTSSNGNGPSIMASRTVSSLQRLARLDTLVTVVDAERFVSDVLDAASLEEWGLAADEHDDRTVADLLVEQVEFADVLVVNKTDLVTQDQLGRLVALLHRLNVSAKVLCVEQGKVPMAEVVNTGRFDLTAAHEAPGWLAELNRFEMIRPSPQQHVPGDNGSSNDGHSGDVGRSTSNSHSYSAADYEKLPSNSHQTASSTSSECAHSHTQADGRSHSDSVVAQQHHSHPASSQCIHNGHPAQSSQVTDLAHLDSTTPQHDCSPDVVVNQHSHTHDTDSNQHDHSHSHGQGGRWNSEADKYGISSFVYFARRPFHPQRLMEHALAQKWEGVLRTKGFFWVATRHDIMGVWQSAGGAWQGEPSARWAALLPEDERPQDMDTTGWDAVYGDRCQQIVWIGINMQEQHLREMLDACLLTDEELAEGPEAWAGWEDPLPEWGLDQDVQDISEEAVVQVMA